jgi:hypothetical protein
VWRLFRMATTFGTRPSTLLAIDDTWQAYQFDEAVLVMAGEVQRRVDQAEARALERKADAGKAAQKALEAALGLDRAVRPSERGRRYNYDLSSPEPRVVKVAG